MRRFSSVSIGVARRNIRAYLARPALLLPPLIGPLVFLAAFAGGLAPLSDNAAFRFAANYTTFSFVLAQFQGATFAGLGGGLGLARDFESGFVRRLMLAAPDRRAIIAGYLLSVMALCLVTQLVLLPIGFVAGVEFEGSALDIAGLVGLMVLASVIIALWASGIAMRMQTVQAQPMMQIPVLLAIFIAPSFVPYQLLTGWIHSAASFDPVTAFLDGGRGLITGHRGPVGPALVVALDMVVLFGLWSIRGLRKAEAGG